MTINTVHLCKVSVGTTMTTTFVRNTECTVFSILITEKVTRLGRRKHTFHPFLPEAEADAEAEAGGSLC